MPKHFVYILKLINNKFYIGYTNNLFRRIREHQRESRGQLIYYEAYLSEKVARMRERKLKHYGSAWRARQRRINA